MEYDEVVVSANVHNYLGSEKTARVSLDVGDVYWRDEPVPLRARAEGEHLRLVARVRRASAGPSVRRASGGSRVARVTLRRDPDGLHAAELAPLPPGSYRVTVAGGRTVEPAEDVFVVLREAAPTQA